MITLDLAQLSESTSPDDAPLRRTLTNISLLVAKSKKAVVVTGAGISCSCGVPDFRSSDGLYNLVKERYPDTFVTGKDLFSSSLFRSPQSTSLFYSFIAELKLAVQDAQPSPTHRFIGKLDEKGKLLRSYTQNIDGMEKRVGLICSSTQNHELSPASAASTTTSSGASSRASTPPMTEGRPSLSSCSLPFPSQASSASTSSSRSSSSGPPPINNLTAGSGVTMDKKRTKNVQLHGDIHRVRCMVCSASFEFLEEYVAMFREGEAPPCPACADRAAIREARSARPLASGSLRPAIVLYDENHPNGDLIGAMQTHDLTRTPDLLLVLGTSLKVHGLKRLVKELAKAVHSLPVTSNRPEGGKGRVVFINKTPPLGAEWKGVFDYWIQGECDDWVGRVEEEWRKYKKADWEVQASLDGLPVIKKAAVGSRGTKKKPAGTSVAAKGPKKAPTLASVASISALPSVFPPALVASNSSSPLSTPASTPEFKLRALPLESLRRSSSPPPPPTLTGSTPSFSTSSSSSRERTTSSNTITNASTIISIEPATPRPKQPIGRRPCSPIKRDLPPSAGATLGLSSGRAFKKSRSVDAGAGEHARGLLFRAGGTGSTSNKSFRSGTGNGSDEALSELTNYHTTGISEATSPMKDVLASAGSGNNGSTSPFDFGPDFIDCWTDGAAEDGLWAFAATVEDNDQADRGGDVGSSSGPSLVRSASVGRSGSNNRASSSSTFSSKLFAASSAGLRRTSVSSRGRVEAGDCGGADKPIVNGLL